MAGETKAKLKQGKALEFPNPETATSGDLVPNWGIVDSMPEYVQLHNGEPGLAWLLGRAEGEQAAPGTCILHGMDGESVDCSARKTSFGRRQDKQANWQTIRPFDMDSPPRESICLQASAAGRHICRLQAINLRLCIPNQFSISIVFMGD